MDFSLGEVIIRVVSVLAIALFLTISTVVVVKLCKIDIKDFKQRTGPKFMRIALSANLLFIYAVFLLMYGLDKRNILTLGFSLTSQEVIYSLSVFFLTLLSALFYVYGLIRRKNYEIQWAARDFIRKGEWGSFYLSFAVLFVAALQEEVMFRGYLAYIFQMYGFMTAMLLSTVIFTIWHFIGNKVNKYQVSDWFVGGLLLFFVYMESNSVWVAAIVHFGRNLTNVLVFNIAEKHSLFKWRMPISPKHKTVYTLTCSLFIALVTIFFL